MSWRAVFLVLSGSLAVLGITAQDAAVHATIEQTASTNRAGLKLTIDPTGSAAVEPQDAPMRKTNVDAQLSNRLFEDLKAIGPLSSLPKTHCMKSVSFGTSLYLTYNGETSPDLSCSASPDSKVGRLQKDVRELMQAAHATPNVRRHPRFTSTLPPK